jgi:hypothetical protein
MSVWKQQFEMVLTSELLDERVVELAKKNAKEGKKLCVMYEIERRTQVNH